MIYFDHNATTPLLQDVLDSLLPFYLNNFGNPSSIHGSGRIVKQAVEKAREQVAHLVGCDPVEVVFTSGGSEANNLALRGAATALSHRGNHIITTTVEHPSVENTCAFLEHSGFDVTRVPVDSEGTPDLELLRRSITDRTILISVMYANNETGTIMPVEAVAGIAAEHKIYLHSDAIQAAGKLPVDLGNGPPLHLLSLSAHKLYAPKGVGALIVKKGTKVSPLIYGGSQERNRRAGTENVTGIVGFGAACDIARTTLAEEHSRLELLRTRLEEGLLAEIPDAVLIGNRRNRLPNTTCIAFPPVPADSLLLNLDLAGFAVSSGSACSSGTLRTSPVLAAMGIDPSTAASSLRFSLGRANTGNDIDELLRILPTMVNRLKSSC